MSSAGEGVSSEIGARPARSEGGTPSEEAVGGPVGAGTPARSEGGTPSEAVGGPVGAGTPAELKPPPPVAGNESPEPAVVALVFLLPPLALGGTALGLLLAGGYGWNPLGVGLMLGLVASVVGFAVIRRIFDKG